MKGSKKNYLNYFEIVDYHCSDFNASSSRLFDNSHINDSGILKIEFGHFYALQSLEIELVWLKNSAYETNSDHCTDWKEKANNRNVAPRD